MHGPKTRSWAIRQQPDPRDRAGSDVGLAWRAAGPLAYGLGVSTVSQ
jgi:hypothetical protein